MSTTSEQRIKTKYFEITSEGEIVKLTQNGKRSKKLIIPEEIDGIKIVAIGAYAFANANNLLSVVIPNTIIKIGFAAFAKCSKLTTVTIPNSVIRIEDSLFNSCESLSEVILPGSIISIGEFAFANCPSIESISIPHGVIEIGAWAFTRCNNLEKVYLPKSIMYIKSFAFSGSPVHMVGYAGDESQWKTIEGINNNGLFSSTPSYIFNHDYEDSPASYFITDGANTITGLTEEGRNAKKIIIPKSIDGIEIQSIGYGAFARSNKLEKVKIPKTVVHIGESAFYECTKLKEVNIPEGIRAIKSYAFYKCESLDGISVPKSVERICIAAFKDCINLDHLNLIDCEPFLERNAFKNCPLNHKYLYHDMDTGTVCVKMHN